MIVVRDGERSAYAARASYVAIGVFDGLHRGHQLVIEELLALQGRHMNTDVATVVTFDPPPAQVLAPERAPRLLGTLAQRLEGLGTLGVEQVRVLTFDEELARRSAVDFIEQTLVNELHAVKVLVGHGFQFGHARAGNVTTLHDAGQRFGFDVIEAPTFGEPRWSSSAVRRALDEGDVKTATQMLGRPFVLRGQVEHGDARGGELGFPTANVATDAFQLVPLEGIYAGAARTPDRQWRPAAISIGTRPQFYDGGPMLIEVHLPGYEGDLYGESLDVAFLERLRGEQVFANVDELVAQIGRDVDQTSAIFEIFSTFDSLLLR